jgi:GntR family transcriptional regulator
MSRSPLYERVESVLAGDIAGGSLPPETQLPAEDGLVARFKVSRTTVRKAIQNLVERGLVEVRRGKGTFVTQPKITQELTELTGFVEDMQASGRTPTARLLDRRVVAADEVVATTLHWRLGRWWSGFSVFAWPMVWRYPSMRRICRASWGRRSRRTTLRPSRSSH